MANVFRQRLKESWDVNCLLMLSIEELMDLSGKFCNNKSSYLLGQETLEIVELCY